MTPALRHFFIIVVIFLCITAVQNTEEAVGWPLTKGWHGLFLWCIIPLVFIFSQQLNRFLMDKYKGGGK